MYQLKYTTDSSVSKQIAKLMLNSLYGRFGLTVDPTHTIRPRSDKSD